MSDQTLAQLNDEYRERIDEQLGEIAILTADKVALAQESADLKERLAKSEKVAKAASEYLNTDINDNFGLDQAQEALNAACHEWEAEAGE